MFCAGYKNQLFFQDIHKKTIKAVISYPSLFGTNFQILQQILFKNTAKVVKTSSIGPRLLIFATRKQGNMWTCI